MPTSVDVGGVHDTASATRSHPRWSRLVRRRGGSGSTNPTLGLARATDLRRARGRRDCDQCSWKLDSSTAMTSYGRGSITASSTGVPTLPALHARRPAARRIDASI